MDGRSYWQEQDGTLGAQHQSGAPQRLQGAVAHLLREGVVDLMASRGQTRWGRVLDAGCGLGDWALRLASHAEEVVAFDCNEAFVHRATAAAAARGVRNLRAHVGGLEELERVAEAGPFDLILLAAVLSCLDDEPMASVLRAVRGALSPRGQVYVRASVSNRPFEQRLTRTMFAVYRMPSTYEEAFRKAGFEWDAPCTSEALVLRGARALAPGPLGSLLRWTEAPLGRAAGRLQRRIDQVGYLNWLLRPRS